MPEDTMFILNVHVQSECMLLSSQEFIVLFLPPLDASMFPSCEKARHDVSLPNA